MQMGNAYLQLPGEACADTPGAVVVVLPRATTMAKGKRQSVFKNFVSDWLY